MLQKHPEDLDEKQNWTANRLSAEAGTW